MLIIEPNPAQAKWQVYLNYNPTNYNTLVLTLHTHKHLYLWSDYHTKGVRWYDHHY